MASVIFTYKNGKKRRMPEWDAKVLRKLKKGSYGDEPVQPVPLLAVSEPVQFAPSQQPEPEPETAEPGDGLDEMDRDAVFKFAEESGIKIHGRTSVERAREIIRETFR